MYQTQLYVSSAAEMPRRLAQGSWAAAGSLWIAMEYCGGGSVADLVHAAEAPLDEATISYICSEALAGLAYLHSLGKV